MHPLWTAMDLPLPFETTSASGFTQQHCEVSSKVSAECCPPALRPPSHQSAFSSPPSSVKLKIGSWKSCERKDPGSLRCYWTWEGRRRWEKQKRKTFSFFRAKRIGWTHLAAAVLEPSLNMCWPVGHMFHFRHFRICVNFQCLCGWIGRWNHLSVTCSPVNYYTCCFSQTRRGRGSQLFSANYTVDSLSTAAHHGLSHKMLVLLFKESSSRCRNPPLTCSKNSLLPIELFLISTCPFSPLDLDDFDPLDFRPGHG